MSKANGVHSPWEAVIVEAHSWIICWVVGAFWACSRFSAWSKTTDLRNNSNKSYLKVPKGQCFHGIGSQSIAKAWRHDHDVAFSECARMLHAMKSFILIVVAKAASGDGLAEGSDLKWQFNLADGSQVNPQLNTPGSVGTSMIRLCANTRRTFIHLWQVSRTNKESQRDHMKAHPSGYDPGAFAFWDPNWGPSITSAVCSIPRAAGKPLWFKMVQNSKSLPTEPPSTVDHCACAAIETLSGDWGAVSYKACRILRGITRSYIYICMFACMYVCMHACMYACMHACMYACMYACMHVCMHAGMYACMYACKYVCMHVCMYAWMYVCTHACMQCMCILHGSMSVKPVSYKNQTFFGTAWLRFFCGSRRSSAPD